MKNLKIIPYLIIVLLVIPSILYAWEGKVVSITDGDTIKVLSNDKQVKVRLATEIELEL